MTNSNESVAEFLWFHGHAVCEVNGGGGNGKERKKVRNTGCRTITKSGARPQEHNVSQHTYSTKHQNQKHKLA
jgi:hypothetical protein